jgi:hypothetical protein
MPAKPFPVLVHELFEADSSGNVKKVDSLLDTLFNAYPQETTALLVARRET